eukprot:gene300-6714_t
MKYFIFLLLIILSFTVVESKSIDTKIQEYSIEQIFKNCTSSFNCTIHGGKSKKTAFILAIIPFTGLVGVDRFYLSYWGLGIFKIVVTIFTCGFGGVIWWILDIIAIATDVIDYDGYRCPLINDF